MAITTIKHLAEAAWHHPDLRASYSWVEVWLMKHSAPAEPRRAYVKYAT